MSYQAYNRSVNPDKCLARLPPDKLSQQQLSKAIDQRTFGLLTCSSTASQSQRAHLKLLSAQGAGLFLNAVPSTEAKLDNEPALFIAMLRRWLRMPFEQVDYSCDEQD